MVYFERLGLVKRVPEEGVGPNPARTAIDYRRPVTYLDTVRVDAAVSPVRGSSCTVAFQVWSEAQEAEVAAGEQMIVHFDYRAGRATPIDDALRAAICRGRGNAGVTGRATRRPIVRSPRADDRPCGPLAFGGQLR